MKHGGIMPFSHEDILVSELAGALALACGAEPTTAKRISEAAALHDVGKFAIPACIVNKSASLTPYEFGIMKRHTLLGAVMLSGLRGAFGIVAQNIALFHHERYDGTGYWGKRAEEIPCYCHIVAICDVYVALISRRPYKRVWARDEALNYISTQAGKQFNPVLVHIFLGLMRGRMRE